MSVTAASGFRAAGVAAAIEAARAGVEVLLDALAPADDAFRQISDELRTQYLLAYYPSQRLSDSEFRRIQVSVQRSQSGAELRVRHRTGYYTSKSH